MDGVKIKIAQQPLVQPANVPPANDTTAPSDIGQQRGLEPRATSMPLAAVPQARASSNKPWPREAALARARHIIASLGVGDVVEAGTHFALPTLEKADAMFRSRLSRATDRVNVKVTPRNVQVLWRLPSGEKLEWQLPLAAPPALSLESFDDRALRLRPHNGVLTRRNERQALQEGRGSVTPALYLCPVVLMKAGEPQLKFELHRYHYATPASYEPMVTSTPISDLPRVVEAANLQCLSVRDLALARQGVLLKTAVGPVLGTGVRVGGSERAFEEVEIRANDDVRLTLHPKHNSGHVSTPSCARSLATEEVQGLYCGKAVTVQRYGDTRVMLQIERRREGQHLGHYATLHLTRQTES